MTKAPSVEVTSLAPETVAGLPYPNRSIELGWPRAAIEGVDGRYVERSLFLRTSPMEACELALAIQEIMPASVMAEARRRREHGEACSDTGVLRLLRDGLLRWAEKDGEGDAHAA
ncbi:hypothetical protein [Streptodolium elevatio]|uniref:Uncharacterized protein n=1 Tax=Streptodolium elevatio TaxID=3157996 RepID=A0ABV3DBT6_9ACTN